MRLDDETQWDEIILSLPAPHVLQSATWGAFKSRWGWSVHRFVWCGSTGIQAAAQVLVRRPAGLPLPIAYVAKGPLLAQPDDPELWALVLEDLTAWARTENAAVLKIDPDVPADWVAVAEQWRALGWRRSAEQIQFANTMISDLSLGETGLLAGMKPKTRYNMRLAARRGVRVRHANQEDLASFFELYAETAARDGFAIRQRAYYMDIWSVWLARGQATLILAERSGTPLAGCLPVRFGRTAWFLYGASTTQGREHMASYAAQWESLRWAIDQGCDTYDWWGGPDALVASDRLWGVYRFKAGFGATLRQQLGAWDGPTSLPRREAYHWLYRLRRVWLRLRRWGSIPAKKGAWSSGRWQGHGHGLGSV